MPSAEQLERMRPYVLSKWKCPLHGYYSARTATAVDPERPVLCPECVPEFIEQAAGYTVLPVPFVSKPRWPSKKDWQEHSPTFSKKANLMKRGPVR
jgi:hypothetical protein